jgi:hypothetical protein
MGRQVCHQIQLANPASLAPPELLLNVLLSTAQATVSATQMAIPTALASPQAAIPATFLSTEPAKQTPV